MPICPGCERELVVGYFRVVGVGAQASEPIEKIVATASEAEFQRMTLERLCGKSGKVEVLGKNGRPIGPDKLQRLIREEEGDKDQPNSSNVLAT